MYDLRCKNIEKHPPKVVLLNQAGEQSLIDMLNTQASCNSVTHKHYLLGSHIINRRSLSSSVAHIS
jgi:hypothetical protein